MAAEFTAATHSIPYHRCTKNLGMNTAVQMTHVDCPPSIRCQRDFLLPEKIRLTHHASSQGNARADRREYKSRTVRRHCPSIWPHRPVTAFVVALCSSATWSANESGLPCPAQDLDNLSSPCVFAFAKTIAQSDERLPSPSLQLSTCSPLPRYGV